MLACKGIFATPSMPQPRAAGVGRQPGALAKQERPAVIIIHLFDMSREKWAVTQIGNCPVCYVVYSFNSPKNS